MVCKNCGSQLEEGSKFCGICGTPVVNNEQPVVNNNGVDSTMNSVNNNVNTFSNGVDSTMNSVNNNVNTFSNGVDSTMNSVNNNVNTFNGNVNNSFDSSNEKKSNSNLKNALIILLVCVAICGIALFAVTKLFKKGVKSAEKIDYAINNMRDMKNYNMSINFDIATTDSGEDMNVTVSLKSSIDIDKKLASLNINASTSGMTLDVPAYIDLGSNPAVMAKIPTDNNWYKLSLRDMIDTSSFDFTDTNKQVLMIEDYLRNDEFIEKVSSDLDGADKYILHFTKDVLKKLSEDKNNDFDFSMVEEYGLDQGFDVALYINNKENYVTKMSMDFSGKTFDDITFSKFVFSFEITDVNKIDNIVIPEEALNAQEFDISSLGGFLPSQDSSLDFNSSLYNF